jgi:hypothetical protein
LPDEARDAGGSDDARERYGGAGFGEARGEKRGDVGTGFAGVHANEGVGLGIFAAQISSQRSPSRE